jgi:hypothetical protein
VVGDFSDVAGMSDLISGLPPLPRRRLVSEAGEGADEKPRQEIEDRKGEAGRVVKRLLAIIEDHRQAAVRLGVEMDAALLEGVVLALEAEVRREDPQVHLQMGNEVRSYLAKALYEELLEEPSNILFTTHVGPDVVRYEAMDAGFWGECVGELRRVLLPEG